MTATQSPTGAGQSNHWTGIATSADMRAALTCAIVDEERATVHGDYARRAHPGGKILTKVSCMRIVPTEPTEGIEEGIVRHESVRRHADYGVDAAVP